MALSPKEKQQSYRDRKKVERAPIDRQCDRLRRLLTDHPEMVEKFEKFMTYRNDELRTKAQGVATAV